jgi:hypothetical protein
MLTNRCWWSFRTLGSALVYTIGVGGVGAAFLLSAAALYAQESPPAKAQPTPQKSPLVGLPIDWMSRHILFTNGGNPDVEAAAVRDPHYWINAAIRHLQVSGQSYQPGKPVTEEAKGHVGKMRRDWAVSLGSTTNAEADFSEAPAKYSFNVNGTYSCANDFVVYALTVAPTSSQANIIAYNNLYTGTASSSCPYGPQTPPTTDYTAPTVMWAYQAGTVRAVGSPILSLDGTQIAFIEDNGTSATLNVLTWVSGQGTSVTGPATPGTGGSSLVQLAYTNTTTSGCTASAAGNTQSSPYIDYMNNVAYVGDNNGRLYRITGIFHGTPTLEYCVTMPVNTTGERFTTSPVYDQITNQVFISDGTSLFAYTPGASSFTAVPNFPVQVESTSATFKIIGDPVLDSTNGFVYLFSEGDLTLTNAIASQINLNTSPPTQTTVAIGPSNTAYNFIMPGDFDNAYFTSGPKTGAGTLYACGTEPASTNGDVPSLYALSFSSPNGIINTTPAMSNNLGINASGNPAGACSPLLDFYDGTNDYLFVGTGTGLYGTTSGSNLVTEWTVNTRLTGSSTPTASATNEFGGTSGFVVDNVGTVPQNANIYFGTLAKSTGTGSCPSGDYCAVKLTRSGLQ